MACVAFAGVVGSAGLCLAMGGIWFPTAREARWSSLAVAAVSSLVVVTVFGETFAVHDVISPSASMHSNRRGQIFDVHEKQAAFHPEAVNGHGPSLENGISYAITSPSGCPMSAFPA